MRLVLVELLLIAVAASALVIVIRIWIGCHDPDRLITYPHAYNLSGCEPSVVKVVSAVAACEDGSQRKSRQSAASLASNGRFSAYFAQWVCGLAHTVRQVGDRVSR